MGYQPHTHTGRAFSLSPEKAFSNLTHSLTAGQKQKGRSEVEPFGVDHVTSLLVSFCLSISVVCCVVVP